MSKDGLKPIGEIVKDALSGMGGPVPAIRETVGYLHTHGRGITQNFAIASAMALIDI